MKVHFGDKFEKDIRQIGDVGLNKRIKRIVMLLEQKENISQLSQVKKLEGFKEYYRIRIGDYRLGIKKIEGGVVLLRCLHRKDIYRVFP